jgi:hypothetical protein
MKNSVKKFGVPHQDIIQELPKYKPEVLLLEPKNAFKYLFLTISM